MASNSGTRLIDGTFDHSGGVDSGKATTVQSANNPNGLPRNMLAWLNNATVRGGGVTQRATWQPLCTAHPGGELFQGAWMYQPLGDTNPYIVLSVGGQIYRVRVDTDNSVENLTAANPGTANPAATERVYYAQGEEFLVIQPGDFDSSTLLGTTPLFFDGNTMRRSAGLSGAPKELPAAGPMEYYMGRLWYAQGRQYTAGDIVGDGSSGTLPYRFRDAILRVTENPLAIGGDGFIVPTSAGDIRALKSISELDAAVGQGNLYVGTRKAIYRLQVPVSRQDWINTANAASGSATNMPLQTVIQKRYGFLNDRSVVEHNADLFFKAMDGTRSLALAIRYFQQWGNSAISKNEDRLLQFNDRNLMRFASGIEFDNRIIHTELPHQTPVGPAFQALSVLDLDLITTLQTKLPPAWEGMYEGLDVLQLLEGDFGGLQRGFAIVYSRIDGSVQIWELTLAGRFENGDNRVTWVIEWPAFTFNKEFDLKKLDGAELWIDRLFGTCEFRMQYRTDCDIRWRDWAAWEDCTCRDECEDVRVNLCPPPGYPTLQYAEGCRAIKVLPAPVAECASGGIGRPANVGFQFQPRLLIRGWCRVRGIVVYGLPVTRTPGEGLVC